MQHNTLLLVVRLMTRHNSSLAGQLAGPEDASRPLYTSHWVSLVLEVSADR